MSDTTEFIVTGFVPRLWVMTLWRIFAVDTQFKQLQKRSQQHTIMECSTKAHDILQQKKSTAKLCLTQQKKIQASL